MAGRLAGTESGSLEAEHNPPDSILDEWNIEVDQQTQLAAAQFEIRKNLGNMDIGKSLNALDFYNDFSFNEEINPIADLKLDALID